ncbi:MAG TPA: anhydro-N-acetylmuramic acid kinase [Dongiaceae bacterium]|jgi:anhydro-N-acetylmuramic acid kinase|nr:anhydro-N-acetylmuramic acid kinase [Dongiaceae bacterium]
MEQSRWVIGLMSGTSLDGIDAALLKTDGENILDVGPAITERYDPAFRARLRAALDTREDFSVLERNLTERHAVVVARLREAAPDHEATLIGFHGQTVLHAPERRHTHQLGDGSLLARLTGLDVVYDFRTADVTAGGQGAPLVPAYHAALASRVEKPLAIVNIGGVANVTWIGTDGTLRAFDTGPGNALLDDWMLRHTGQPCDEDGACARRGTVDRTLLTRWLAHDFFARPAPKSLDRNQWQSPQGLSLEDGAATLTAFTAYAIAAAADHFPEPARRWLICGGGRHNRALMDLLRQFIPVPVAPVEAVGWRGDFLEAQAFAFLAMRSLRGLPLSFPETTGAPRPLTGGRYCRAA